MMRITAGEFRNRKIFAPEGKAVRPTSDRVRQAIFNILLSRGLPEDGMTVFDGFCGTGSLGFEAISRGAGFCTFMDAARESLMFCRRNAEALPIAGKYEIINRDITKAGVKPANIQAAGLVFLDPPYRKDLLPPSVQALMDGGWAAPKAVFVLECETGGLSVLPTRLDLIDRREYGETQIVIARYQG